MKHDVPLRVRLLTSGSGSPAVTLDRAGTIMRINDAFVELCSLFGVDDVEPGGDLTEVFPPPHGTAMVEAVERAWRGEIDFAVTEWPDREGGRIYETLFLVWEGDSEDQDLLHLVFRDNTEIHHTERKMERLAGRFQAVLESSVDLNSSIQQPDSVYQATMDKLAGAIEFDTGTIQLLEGDVLRVVAHRGFGDTAILDSLRFPLDDRFPNVRVVRSKQPLALADIRHDFSHFLTDKDQYGSGHIRSWMGVPVIDRGEVWGMVTLDRKRVRPFEGDDIELATAIANHAGVAISNARLYGGLQRAHAIQQTLMQELHHRVKNNMQLISSLLNIREGSLDSRTREILADIRMRILTLAAVHESLYQSPELDTVALSDYMERIIREIDSGYTPGAYGVVLRSEVSKSLLIHVDQAIPLGMIVSELLLNSVKHAFPQDALTAVTYGTAEIFVTITPGEAGLEVEVRDNGRGMPDNGPSGDSFGMVLVYTLAEQLEASVALMPGDSKSIFGSGTVWRLEVPIQ
jgi:two-component sensor histidine kinase